MFVLIVIFIVACIWIFTYLGFKSLVFFNKNILTTPLSDTRYTRFLTFTWVHDSWWHATINSFVLLALGATMYQHLAYYELPSVYALSALVYLIYLRYAVNPNSTIISYGAYAPILALSVYVCLVMPSTTVFLYTLRLAPVFVFNIGYFVFIIYLLFQQVRFFQSISLLIASLTGVALALIFHLDRVLQNPYYLLAVLLGLLLLLYMQVRHLKLFQGKKNIVEDSKFYTIDDKYNDQKQKELKNIDAILDKINEKGISSLTPSEKKILDDYSNL